MKKFFLIPVISFFIAGAALAQSNLGPEDLVKQTVNEVMAAVKADKSIQAGDIQHISELVQEKILPHADFQRTTRLVMGRNWNKATPEQQQQITEQFKQLLIHTYSGAIAQIRNQTVTYLPYRGQPGDTDAVIRTQVINNGQPIEIDYRLEKTPAGWKVYDINVLGAWLIQAYRDQFTQQISERGVSGLLSFLTERNRQLASGTAK
ncbi:phospholipid-binding protein MlaC [Pandoraea sp.]|uniref:MlaC/ttg2D family ABC transporter substrate-binding protein n=1 Tax=Pandoraea sp. TaxID=1883445 RepID=UPI001213CA1F|nr:ABC transporter substrate-binding protein [Pandoraea sp.]MBU6492820.1 ABC transporter substrate-binding protein [Burkholderiales bacterium]MDE2287220.1 ABC transporter substrate-binding protein [Burkholderiales bacterium]MDE2608867.1 ABC transporter substrate-binding protein [Burkholderiales bacterium]TAL53766.1 MAG: ABC transporter substrate-binding protein [Pandoraea sp.]TAM17019.1 MAG: ABC transporter substrate-binding protein [Pandoraea sp.]